MPDILSCLSQGSKNLPMPKISGKSLSLENVLVGCAIAGITYVVGTRLLGRKDAGKLLENQLGDNLGKLFK